MGAAVSLYEGGSCASVAQGQLVGREFAFPLQVRNRDVCHTTEYVLRQELANTTLRTLLFPDIQVSRVESPRPGARPVDTLFVYPSRDSTCSTQARLVENPFPINLSDGLDEVICQNVESGFLLYCISRLIDNNEDESGLEPCPNVQNLLTGVVETFPLSEVEMQNAKLEEITERLRPLTTPPPTPKRRRRGRGRRN